MGLSDSLLAFHQLCPFLQGKESMGQGHMPISMATEPLDIQTPKYQDPRTQRTPKSKVAPLPEPALAASLVYPPNKLGC